MIQVMSLFHRKYLLLVIFIVLFAGNNAFSQLNQQKIPEKTRILFLLDASGSMLARWENTYRIVVAKRLLSDMVDSLKNVPNVDLALRVYGHQSPSKIRNCQDSKLEVPFRAGNHEAIKNRLASITPQGNTPIAYSIERAAEDFPKDGLARNVIIIITDGLESCDGDPCAVSMALQKRGIFLKPFIVGIGMDYQFEEQFKCVGDYYDASNIRNFKDALNQIVNKSLQRATISVELLDINDQPKETDVNITFINNFTRGAAYEFVHYLDQKGRPDSVEVDPILSYDIVVNTIPKVVKSNVEIEGGKHNIIRIKSPQGFIRVLQKGHSEYKKGVKVLIRRPGHPEIIHVMEIQDMAKVLVGDYDIEALTLPRAIYKNISIRQSQTTSIDIPAPGLINISAGFQGIGSIYLLKSDGSQEWVCNIDPNVTRSTMTIQPGDYKIVFRSKNSLGSKFTQIRNFNVKSGVTTDIRLNF
jgi:Ca-activated chloride channel homolog